MRICPRCGNIIPDWADGVCYRCARIGKEERRYGRRGGERKSWLRSTPPPPPPHQQAPLSRPPAQSKRPKSQGRTQPQSGKNSILKVTYPVRGNLARLKGINKLLETIYGEPRFISDFLRVEGIEEEGIQLIKRHHLEDYLNKFVDGLSKVFDNPKWDRLLEIVRYRYGIAEGEEMTLQAIGDIYGLSRERIRQLQNKAIRIMKNPRRKRRLENMAMNVAKDVLGQDSR